MFIPCKLTATVGGGVGVGPKEISAVTVAVGAETNEVFIVGVVVGDNPMEIATGGVWVGVETNETVPVGVAIGVGPLDMTIANAKLIEPTKKAKTNGNFNLFINLSQPKSYLRNQHDFTE